MKSKHISFSFTFFLLFFVNSLLAQSAYDYQVRCIGREMDGSLTLESYGKGRNYKDASEQAKKEAVRAVIFTGIRTGNGGCESDPLIFDKNLERIHEDYFADFFKDGGEYLKFVSLKDEKIANKVKRNKMKDEEYQQRMVVVRVSRLELKKKFKSDLIIK